jgi:N-acetylmuramoyl-L-alanine amidase
MVGMSKNAIVCLLTLIGFTLLMPSLALSYSRNEKTKFIVAIDIGHSRSKQGAVSSTGIGEYFFNEIIGKILLSKLNETRNTEAFLVNHDGTDISLRKRVEIANARNADLFISIHHDSVQRFYLSSWVYKGRKYFYCDKYAGFSIFYSEKNAKPRESVLFAKMLGNDMLKEGFNPSLHHREKIKGENRELIDHDRGIYRFDELQILKQTKMPAILFECGIIVNRDEENKLKDPIYQGKIVSAILHSIDLFFKFKSNNLP